MAQSKTMRALIVALLFAGVCLIAVGIGLILRSDFTTSGGWTVILLAPAAIIAGTVLVFIPIFRWFLLESVAAQNRNE
jgi:hypothetical protein